jgi:2-methylcitrate dehydratase
LSHWKCCAFAGAARQGVFAALLAQAGVTGPAPIFEGEKGFEKLVSGPLSDLHIDRWGSAEKEDFMILRCSIKFWPAEYHAQSAIEAALALREWAGSADQIAMVRIQSHDAAVDIIGSEMEKWRPEHRETADHSLPYLVAAALMDGEITARQFTPERLADPAQLALTQRVAVERHAELSGLYPQAVGNIVTVTLRDGRSRTERVDHPRGHAQRPLTTGEVELKFHALADPVLGPERAAATLSWLWKLDKAKEIKPLWRLLAEDRQPSAVALPTPSEVAGESFDEPWREAS